MKLIIDDFICYAKLGIYDWEKVIHRKLLVHIEVDTSDIIDYDNVVSCTRKFIVDNHFDYIEDLAKALLKNCIATWGSSNQYLIKLNKTPITCFENGAIVECCS
ncbi:hypothetical protein GUI12_01315 [Anaplasmataceae bacterium AB001_6]|nr:hypothetical protein GUI12_01315 [Anaplasmataceae bacterium AB001_6]